MNSNENCPCGRNKPYNTCCKQIHDDIAKATTAEDLMRSRYTAFTKANGNYLLLSHHSSTQPTKEIKEIIAWAKSVVWDHLEIFSIKLGGINDTVGYVEFKAYFFEQQKLKYIHENSKFVKENGVWVYLGVK